MPSTDDLKKHLGFLIDALKDVAVKRHKKVKDQEGRVLRSFSWPGTGAVAVVVTDPDDKMVLHTIISTDLDPDDSDTLKGMAPIPKVKPIKVQPASPPLPGAFLQTGNLQLGDHYFAWDPEPEEGGDDFIGGGLFGIVPKKLWDAEKRWDDADFIDLPDDAPIQQEMEGLYSVREGCNALEARQWLKALGATENVDILNWQSYQDGSKPKYDAASIHDALEKLGALVKAHDAQVDQKVAATVLPQPTSGQLSEFYFSRDLEVGFFGESEDGDSVILVRKKDWDATRQWGGLPPTEEEMTGLPLFPFLTFRWNWEPGCEWAEIKAELETAGAVYNTSLRSQCHPLESESECVFEHPFPHAWIAKHPLVKTVIQVIDSLLGIGVDKSKRPDLLTKETLEEADGDPEDIAQYEMEAWDELLFEKPDKFLEMVNTGISEPTDPILGPQVVAALSMMASVDYVWESFTTDWSNYDPKSKDGGESVRTSLIRSVSDWALGKRTAVDGREVGQ